VDRRLRLFRTVRAGGAGGICVFYRGRGGYRVIGVMYAVECVVYRVSCETAGGYKV